MGDKTAAIYACVSMSSWSSSAILTWRKKVYPTPPWKFARNWWRCGNYRL